MCGNAGVEPSKKNYGYTVTHPGLKRRGLVGLSTARAAT